jgi:DNA helicase-2/ATP-dependent DNA helicase PcrA
MKKYVLKKQQGFARKDYKIDYQGKLNPRQFKAVTNVKGPQLVIAGAGTGKTQTLVYRVAFLVENSIDPKSILLLTFTRKAAGEMMRRAALMLDDRCEKVSGGTFHSFANLILRKYFKLLGYSENFTIIDRSDSEDIINFIRTEMGFNKKERRFPKKKTIMEIISKSINTGRPFEKILMKEYPHFMEEEDNLKTIAKQYAEYKNTKSIMDYDDLLVNFKKLLEKHDNVRKKISLTYKYIMVDEYQDTNKLQADIACLLASEHDNIMVVGDDSQSIYAFRGANFKNIMDFPNLFPGCRRITLEQNYRSCQPVLNLTNSIIENAQEKYEKYLFTQIKGGPRPIYLRTRDDEEQSSFICQRILELREEGVELSDIAVLFRAAWHSNELEVELAQKNIPYVKYGGIKFIETAHVKDMVSLVRLIYNHNDAIAWYRILLLIEGVGPVTANRIIRQIVNNNKGPRGLVSDEFKGRDFSHDLKRFFNAVDRILASAPSPTEEISELAKFYLPLLKKKYDDYHQRARDLESLERIAERYRSVERFLTDLSLEPPDKSQMDTEQENRDDEKLILSTIHSAKGLEWHSVFVIHLVDGYLPSMMSLSREEIEEERRLFYVAATRAKQNLYLLSPHFGRHGGGYHSMSGFDFSKPSRFISEIKNFKDITEEWVLEEE